MSTERLGAGAFGSRLPIERLVARHGVGRVLGAALAASLRGRRRRRERLDRLSNHLRRDIGLRSSPADAAWRRGL